MYDEHRFGGAVLIRQDDKAVCGRDLAYSEAARNQAAAPVLGSGDNTAVEGRMSPTLFIAFNCQNSPICGFFEKSN